MATASATRKDRDTGLAAVVVATVVFSAGFPITKSADLAPDVFSFWRLFIGAVALHAMVAVSRRRNRARGRPDRRSREGRPLVVAAGVLFGVHQLVAVEAILRTSISIVTLVAALQPLVVALVAQRVVAERVPAALVGWASVGVLSVAVVVQANLGDASQSAAGNVLAVVNLVVFTAYFLLAKRAREAGVPALDFTAGAITVAWLVVAPVALLRGDLADVEAGAMALVALVALGPGQGHVLVNWAHTRVSAALASLVLAGMPLLAGLWAHLIHHEPYGWRHVVGMALMIVAIDGGRRVERSSALAAPPADPI